MGWGKYTNEELGINRNITCSMFTGKGVDVQEAKDIECATKKNTLADYYDALIYTDAEEIYTRVRNKILANRNKYRNYTAKQLLEQEAGVYDVGDMLKESQEYTYLTDDQQTRKQMITKLIKKFWKDVYSYIPALQKFKDDIENQTKSQLSITHLIDICEKDLQGDLDLAVEEFDFGDNIKTIRSNERKIEAKAKKIVEDAWKEYWHSPPGKKPTQKAAAVNEWITKNKGRLIRQTIAALHEQKMSQIEDVAIDLCKNAHGKEELSAIIPTLEQLVQMCDVTLKNGYRYGNTKHYADYVKKLYKDANKRLNAPPKKAPKKLSQKEQRRLNGGKR